MRLKPTFWTILPALTLIAGPCLAAEAADEGGGMPQFDTSHFPEQIFWLAITFVVLYLLMAYVALPSVQRTQSKRSKVIADDLAAAQKANDDAKAMMAAYEKALAEARVKAQAMVNEISAQAGKISAEQQAVQHKELAKRLAEAEAKIAAARDAAVRDVKSSAADLANAIIDKVTIPGARHVA